MLSSDYLIKGITGLSRANESGPMEGHYGAAVIAAYYFCRENALDEKTEFAVQNQIDQFIAKFEPFFVSLPAEDPEPGSIQYIVQALEANVHQLRAIGHNVIFTALALKALQDMPHLATPQAIKGICKLIGSFDQANRGGPFPGWEPSEINTVTVNPEDQFPSYDDDNAIIQFTFDALLKIRKICTGMHEGTIGHLLTHADALIELSRLGYPETAKKAYLSHQIHVKLATRFFVPAEWGEIPRENPSQYNHLTHSYWEQDLEQGQSHWKYGHIFKYPYSFYRMINYVTNQNKRQKCQDKFAYLM